MARMHSGSKGKSGSKPPLNPVKPTWVRYKPKEVEMLIIKLAKEGKPAAQIGLILRDMYGVPSVKQLLGQTIGTLLKEKKVQTELPEDVMSLMKRCIEIRKHLALHRKDTIAARGLTLTESKIKRLAKYYKRVGRMPVDWKYVAEQVHAA